MTMFVISEVHPFVDGNGRIARLRMNAEVSVAGQARLLVPTAFQQDYLGALRRLSRASDPTPLVRALDRGQAYSQEVPFGPDRRATEAVLAATGAFDPEGVLRLPSELNPVKRKVAALSSAAQLALAALRVFPDQSTAREIADGPLGVDQLDVDDVEQGLNELRVAGRAAQDSAGRWSLT